MRQRVSFCFDDGFARSAQTIRKVFEDRGAAACFAVLTEPEHSVDPNMAGVPIADWSFWQDTAAAGHEIGLHGRAHEHLGKLRFDEARASIDAAVDAFDRYAPSQPASEPVFHLPYLSAPDDVIEYVRQRYGTVRMGSAAGQNTAAAVVATSRLNCLTFGPVNVDQRLRDCLETHVAAGSEWLVVVLHGLDDEGWGPISLDGLTNCLDYLLTAGVEIIPPGQQLAIAAKTRARLGQDATP